MDGAVYQNGVLRMPVNGEIDHHGARVWRDELDELIRVHRPRELLLDLQGVAFMDSAGLGLLLGRYRHMCTLGGRLVLLHAPASCVKMLRLSGADRFIYLKEERKEESV